MAGLVETNIGDSEFLSTMSEMMDELETDPAFLPSEFWRELNQKNSDMLLAEGLVNFKRTVSQNYFNWLVTTPRHPQFLNLALRWLFKPGATPFHSRIEHIEHLRMTNSSEQLELSSFQERIYRIFVSILWDTMRRTDHEKLSDVLSEPLTGNPINVFNGERLISQDLATSIMECNLLIKALKNKVNNPKIAEIGAGYGRLAHVYSATQPGQYFIFDIPPALYVSQWYISDVIGEDKIFKFRAFDHLEDVEDEMSKASVVFLTANQISKFPEHYFDLMLSISTLPEMRREQIQQYIEILRTKSDRFIFLKQWKSWHNPQDNTTTSKSDYQFGPEWNLTHDTTDPIDQRFFNCIWERDKS